VEETPDRTLLIATGALTTIGLITGFWDFALLIPLAWVLAVALPM
jgi:uncharacterized membrane protein required for colicin V production